MAVPETPDTVAAFARDLTEARREAGRSIRQVHRLTGIPTATLGGYFSGRHLPPANRPEVLVAVLEACAVPAGSHAAWRRRLLALYGQRRQPEVTRTPYPGLRPFEAGDHDLFFGREQLVDRLLALLQAARTPAHRVVMVVGPSGSGKSSLLRAGLQAALEGVDCTVCRPSELEGVLASPDGAAGAVPGTALERVVVVDQLEELWSDPDLRARADEVLDRATAWAHQAPGRLLVLGLRADFYGEAMLRPALADALGHRQLLVEPLDQAGMRTAIEGPARQVGLTLEPGLVDVILADVRQDTVGSVLPHLAHVLDTMWGSSDRKALTVEDYRRAGGFEGAIRLSAERALTTLPPDHQTLAMTLLLRMVTTSAAQGWTRRLAPLAELDALDAHTADVLAHLVACRLVTVHADDATLSHESLVGAWPRLREAVEARRGDLARREALDRAATDWDAHGRSEDHLLRGSRLQAALDWRASAGEPLTPLHTDYLAASSRLADRLEADRRAGLRRRRVVTAAMAVLLLVTTAAGLIAVRSSDQARTERDQAQSRQMAVAAATMRDANPSLSRQLAVAAYRAASTREGRSAVLDATTSPVITAWSHEGVTVERAATLSGGEHLLFSGPTGGVRVVRASDGPAASWEVVGAAPLSDGPGDPVVTRLATHPTRPLAVAAGSFVTQGADPVPLVALLDLTDPRAPGVQLLDLPAVPSGVVFAGGGDLLVVADVDGALHRFAVGAGAQGPDAAADPVGEAVRAGELVEGLAASDDGRLVAAALTGGTVRAWRVEGAELVAAGEHDTGRGLFALDVAADGSAVAAVGRSGLVHWLRVDPDGLTQTHGLFASDTNLFAVKVDADSGLVAAAGFEGTVSMWRVGDDGPLTEAPSLVLPVPRPVLDIDVAGGRWVFSTLGGTAYTWDQSGAVLPRMAGNVFLVGASREGDRFMTSTGPPDAAVTIWDAGDPHAPAALHTLRAPGEDASTGAGAVSQDGRLAAMGTGEGRLLVWRVDADEPDLVVDVPGAPDGVAYVLFTPDSEAVLAFGRTGSVRLVGLEGGARGQVLGEVTLGGAVLSAGMRADGLVATSDDADGVRLLDVGDLGTTVAELDLGTDVHVYGLEFSPDGDLLALAASDNRIYLYDVTDPSAPALVGEPLTGPTAITNSVKFSPDGQRLAVAVISGQAWIFERQGDAWVATEVLRAGLVNLQDVTWSADGSVLLGGALAGRTRLWLTDVESAADTVCSTVARPITQEEWAGLLPGIDYAPPCGPAS